MTKYESLQTYVDSVVSEAIDNPSEENVSFARLTQQEWEEWKDTHSLAECE